MNRKQRRREKSRSFKGLDSVQGIQALYGDARRHRLAGRLGEAEQIYRQIIEVEPRHSESRHDLGLIAYREGRYDAAVASIREAIRLRDDVPAYHCNLGAVLQDQGFFNDAVEHYERALALKPDHPEANYNLGKVFHAQKDLDNAILHYQQAIAIRSNYPEAHAGLGIVLGIQGKLDQALAHCKRAIVLKPNLAEAHNNLGVVLQDLGKVAEALVHHERALALKPNLVGARRSADGARLLLGDFAAGLAEHEWLWRDKGTRTHERTGPMWDGGNLRGKTILLDHVRGMGDSIQFVRYARMAGECGGRVLLACPRSLARLFKSMDGIDRIFPHGRGVPYYDCHAPLLSLPFLFRTSLHTIPASVPYLRSEPRLAARWRKRLSGHPGLRVGVIWRGNPEHMNDRNRSMAPADFAAFLDVPGITVVSLQKDSNAEEIKILGMRGSVFDAGGGLKNFSHTAALMTNLDLVISVDTSCCHLAGALGMPVWTLLPFAPDWRWMLKREDSPWYPTMRLFRQPAIGDWQAVVEQVREALHDLAAGDRPMMNSATKGVVGHPATESLGDRIRRWLGAP